jgi:hypothetical protein
MDENHSHQMTHRYEPGDDSQGQPGTVTSTVDFEHAHDGGSAPHYHADAANAPEPEPPEVKPLIPLWVPK